jgi:DNA polymerase III epsilon subunit-like protein
MTSAIAPVTPTVVVPSAVSPAPTSAAPISDVRYAPIVRSQGRLMIDGADLFTSDTETGGLDAHGRARTVGDEVYVTAGNKLLSWTIRDPSATSNKGMSTTAYLDPDENGALVISPEATARNHLDRAALMRHKPVSEREAFEQMESYLAERAQGRPVVLAFHNAPFDATFISAALGRLDQETPGAFPTLRNARVVDTLEVCRRMAKADPAAPTSMRLDAVHPWLAQKERTGALHSSSFDTRLLNDVVKSMEERGESFRLQPLYRLKGAIESAPAHEKPHLHIPPYVLGEAIAEDRDGVASQYVRAKYAVATTDAEIRILSGRPFKEPRATGGGDSAEVIAARRKVLGHIAGMTPSQTLAFLTQQAGATWNAVSDAHSWTGPILAAHGTREVAKTATVLSVKMSEHVAEPVFPPMEESARVERLAQTEQLLKDLEKEAGRLNKAVERYIDPSTPLMAHGVEIRRQPSYTWAVPDQGRLVAHLGSAGETIGVTPSILAMPLLKDATLKRAIAAIDAPQGMIALAAALDQPAGAVPLVPASGTGATKARGKPKAKSATPAQAAAVPSSSETAAPVDITTAVDPADPITVASPTHAADPAPTVAVGMSPDVSTSAVPGPVTSPGSPAVTTPTQQSITFGPDIG